MIVGKKKYWKQLRMMILFYRYLQFSSNDSANLNRGGESGGWLNCDDDFIEFRGIRFVKV